MDSGFWRSNLCSLGGWGLLPHDVHPVEVAVVALLRADDGRGRDGRLGHEMVRNRPVEVAALEVVHALLLHAVGDADVDAVGREHAMDLREHLRGVGAGAITAQNRVERALVDHGVECAVLILQLPDVHLLVDHAWVALFVHFGHLLLHSERDVNVAQILVTILKHLLREA